MQRSPGSPPPRDPMSLDFEPTDFASARAALDELPAGVGRLHAVQHGYWEARRRPAQPADRALAGATIDWLLSLPPPLRPRRLGERFPRLANALAQNWRDPVLRTALIDELLIDRRGGRQGFPPEVRGELEALRRG
jgi:hypothetical protein